MGEAGRQWIAGLPNLVERLCDRWNVDPTGDEPRGDWNLVLLARRGEEDCVLKLCWPERSGADEATALLAWDGHGAVRLLEASPDDGALLLERLDVGRSLDDLDLFSAAEVAGSLVRRLSIPAPSGLPRLTDEAVQTAETVHLRQKRLGDPLPARWVDLTHRMARDLAADPGTDLVHGDLHYLNILAGEREPWLAIDPKPLAGVAERPFRS